jgi:GNAT superfamily N-acetyltransferase
MTDLTLRPALPDDADALVPLIQQLGYDTTASHLAGWLAGALPARDCAWVALLDGHITGVISLQYLPLIHQAETLARVTALVVAEQARGRGVASALLRQAEDAARLRGCLRMEITSSNYRHDAHAFYRHHGYQVPDVTRFVKPL